MVDRQMFGDLALAVLLALPLAWLARPDTMFDPETAARSVTVSAPATDRAPGGRMSLLS